MSKISIARERSLYTGIADQDVPEIRRDLSRLREQISTGKRINRPSDAPDSYAVAERMQTLSNQFTRHDESIAAARPWVDRTQEELDQMGELFTRAHEEGLRAANESLSESDRDTIAQTLRSIRDEVTGHLNASHNGEYLFAGNRTSEKPFDNTGQPTVSYAAISGARERTIGQNQRLTINVNGKELHQMGGGQTIVGALDTLITAVENDDTSDIQNALSDTEAARDHVIDRGAKAGTIGRRLSAAEDQLQSAKLSAERRRSEAEDANLAKAVSEMRQKQTQLQAALKATASTQQTSLVNVLG